MYPESHCRYGRHLVGLLGALALGAFACSDDGPTDPPADAAIATPDASLPDASIAVDAQTVDAMPPDAAVAPAFRRPLITPDVVLANQALELLGHYAVGATKNCGACHGMTRQTLRYWESLTDISRSNCLFDLGVTTPENARAMLDCMRVNPTDPTSAFQASHLGAFSTAAHLDWFSFTFWRAADDGAGDWEAALQQFQARVGMPQGAHPQFSQEDFNIVAEWFARGLPLLDDIVPEDPPPTTCVPNIAADVGAHVDNMAVIGWTATNAENNLLMFGCGGAANPEECLTSYPQAGTLPYGVDWESLPGAKLRVLRDNPYRSAFWTRSSADGRFVAHGASGGGMSSAIVDLQNDTVIPTSAAYDPAFFPDNSGFMFQGGQASFCPHSVLTSTPKNIDYTEPGCVQNNAVGLYQHVGAALGGGDYWAVDGQFVSDNGGIGPTLSDPSANFSMNASIDLTPMVNNGGEYVPQPTIRVDTPFEGDTVIAPSAQLLLSRVNGPNGQLGFTMRKMVAIPNAGGYEVFTPQVARYCINGGKPAYSLDERWLVLHHYIQDEDAIDLGFTGPSDPGFQDYRTQGAANIYLLEVATGQVTRVTNMAPGQYALFPHFRSDGWIYFMVRTLGSSTEHIVASDSAFVLSAQ